MATATVRPSQPAAGRTEYRRAYDKAQNGNIRLEPTHICEGVLINISRTKQNKQMARKVEDNKIFPIVGKFFSEYIAPELVSIENGEEVSDVRIFLVEVPFEGICTAMAAINAPHGYAEHHTGWVATNAVRESRTVLLTWPARLGGKRVRIRFEDKYILNAETE